jgi:two-component system alkaline phosphatase synthesis response regulator PhoP
MDKKILLIEDDEQIRSMYQVAFEAQGFSCQTAGDGAKGLEMVKNDKPDLILLDIMMPNVDGMTVLSDLKKDPELSMIPVIMLSNLSIQEGIDKAMALGAKDYINKSLVKPREVVEKVKAILSNPI